MIRLYVVLVLLLAVGNRFDCFKLHASFGYRKSKSMTGLRNRSSKLSSIDSTNIDTSSQFDMKPLVSENEIDYVDIDDEDEPVFDVVDTDQRNNAPSKNEIRRQRRFDRWTEVKAAFYEPIEREHPPSDSVKRVGRRNEVVEHYLANKNKSFTVLVDCDWEEIHSPEELSHLANQLLFTYGINRKHTHPADVRVTGVGPKLQALLGKNNAHNWMDFPITSDRFQTIGVPRVPPSADSDPPTGPARNKTMIYLSPDADHVLTSVDPSCCYIIGGIVDRSVRKFLTTDRAREHGLPSARLPIKEHVQTGKVALPVNQVVQILLNFAATKDWRSAIEPVIPKRKIGK